MVAVLSPCRVLGLVCPRVSQIASHSSLITASSEGKWPRFIGDPCAAGSSQSRYCWWRGYLPRSGGEMTRLSIGGKSRKGVNRSQARSQVVTVWGYLTPMSDSEKSVRACQAASWFGAVQIGLESGRDLPAVPVGDEPHRGPDQVDHAGLDRRLGPGRLDRLGKAGEPVTFPRALRSRAGGAPPFYDQHVLDAPVGQLSADEPPFKEAPSPDPGPRYLSHVLDSRPSPTPTAM